jgi:Ran GTPase-activating protein (RanGAP) involved in mRNA processing and transport
MAWGKTESAATEWCKRIRADDETFTDLAVLPFRPLPESDVLALATDLTDNTHLASFNASGKELTVAGLNAMGEMLRVNRGIKSLAIGHAELGDTGLATLTPGLVANTGVAHLDLSYKGLTEAAAGSLRELASASTTLQTVVLSRNALGDTGVAGLIEGCRDHPSATALSVLVLSECALTSAAVLNAAECWARLSSVTELVLSSNAIGSIGGIALGRILQTHGCSLAVLELNKCELGSEGTNAIAEAAPSCDALRRLHLGDNEVSAESVEKLCGMIADKAGGFVALSLRNNPGIADGGGITRLAAELTRLPAENAVISLNLSQCGVSPRDLPALLAATSLVELHVNCNDLSAGLPLRACQMGADPAIGPDWLHRASALKVLDLSGGGFPEDDGLLLLDTLRSDLAALPALEMLGLGGERDDRGKWQSAVDDFRMARPTALVAWE